MILYSPWLTKSPSYQSTCSGLCEHDPESEGDDEFESSLFDWEDTDEDCDVEEEDDEDDFVVLLLGL